jgi:hypothetical protein
MFVLFSFSSDRQRQITIFPSHLSKLINTLSPKFPVQKTIKKKISENETSMNHEAECGVALDYLLGYIN